MYHVRQTDQECRRHALNMFYGHEDLTSPAFAFFMDEFASVYPYLQHPRDYDAIVSHQDNVVSYVLRRRYGYESIYVAPYSLGQLEMQLGLRFENLVDPSINAFFMIDPASSHIWTVRRGGASDDEWYRLDSMQASPQFLVRSKKYRVALPEDADKAAADTAMDVDGAAAATSGSGNQGGTADDDDADCLPCGVKSLLNPERNIAQLSNDYKHGYIIPLTRTHALKIARRAKKFVEAYFLNHPLFRQVNASVLSKSTSATADKLAVFDRALHEDVKGFVSTADEDKAVDDYQSDYLRVICEQRHVSKGASYESVQSHNRLFDRLTTVAQRLEYLERSLPVQDVDAPSESMPDQASLSQIRCPRLFLSIFRVVATDIKRPRMFSAYECLLNKFFIWWDYATRETGDNHVEPRSGDTSATTATPSTDDSQTVRAVAQSAANVFARFQVYPADSKFMVTQLPFLVYYVFISSLGNKE